MFVPGSEAHLSVEPSHFWKGIEWELGRKMCLNSLILSKDFSPWFFANPSAPGAEQSKGRKASE